MSRPAARTARSTPAPRRARVASDAHSGSRTPASAECSTTTSPTRAGPSLGLKRARPFSASTCRKPSCSTTPAARSTTRCSSGFSKRMSRGLQFNLAYTYSRSMDTSSADPGSTSGGGKPDAPEHRFRRAGRSAQTSTRTTRCRISIGRTDSAAASSGSCRARACSTASVSPGSCSCSRVCRIRSTPRNRSSANVSQYGDLVRGSGGLYRLGFGRPSLCGSLDELRQAGDDPTEAAFNRSVLCSPTTLAGGYPDNLGVRQSGPERAPRLLAATCRPEPGEGVFAWRRTELRSAVGCI